MAGAAPQVMRNKGSIGSKDLHLENFSVSNGGAELIEVRFCVCASSMFWHQSAVTVKKNFVKGVEFGVSSQ